MTASRQLAWHYTTGEWFQAIVESGVILPSTAYIDPDEKPIVWFSLNSHWEQTANKLDLEADGLRTLSMEETAAHCGGLDRFGVCPAVCPYTWRELKQLSGMSPRIAAALYRIGIEQGARPGQWRGTFEPVGREQWRLVDVYQAGVWVRIPLNGEPSQHGSSPRLSSQEKSFEH
jgi:hypothetical protein